MAGGHNRVREDDGAGEEFTDPTDIAWARAMWFDAADAASFTLSGSTVTAWNDKSGNGRNLQPGSTNPQRGAVTLNGKPVVSFDGGDQLYWRASSGYINTTTLTVAMVVWTDGSWDNQRAISLSHFNSFDYDDPRGAVPIAQLTGFTPAGYRNSVPISHATALNSVTWMIVYSIFDGTNHTMYVNNVAQAPVASAGTFDFDLVSVGANHVGGENLHGNIAEVVTYTQALGSTDRTNLYDYLIAKWLPPWNGPEIVGTATQAAAASGPLTIAKPAGTAVGETLLIAVWGFSPTAPTWSYACTGFTLLAKYDATSGARGSLGLLARTVDGTEGSSFSVSATSSAVDYLEMLCFRVDRAVTAITGGGNTGTGTTGVLESIAAVDNTLVLGLVSGWSSTAVPTPPAGWVTAVTMTDPSQRVFSLEATGPITDTSFSWSASEQWAAMTVGVVTAVAHNWVDTDDFANINPGEGGHYSTRGAFGTDTWVHRSPGISENYGFGGILSGRSSDAATTKDQYVKISISDTGAPWGLFVRAPATIAIDQPGYWVNYNLGGTIYWYSNGSYYGNPAVTMPTGPGTVNCAASPTSARSTSTARCSTPGISTARDW